MSQNLRAPAVVPDANILIALCSNEQLTFAAAEAAFEQYVRDGWEFFAPSIISAEVLYVLCQKAVQGILTEAEYKQSVELFINYMIAIAPPDVGDSSLIKRAEEIRDGYGCSRSSDGFYIALAEELAKTRTTELLTFDKGFINQAAKNAPTITVTLLSI